MKLRLFIVGLIAAALIGGLAWFQFVMKPQMIREFMANMPQPPITVAATEAVSEPWIPRIRAVGTLRAVNGVEITPQVAGVVKEIHFKSGQDVAERAPLVTLDDDMQQADLKAALATMKNAELNYERIYNLFKGGNAPKSTLDDAQRQRDEAVARVEQIRAQIAHKHIGAPFSGRLGIRQIDIGQYLSPGTAIVTLQALHPIYVDFSVPSQEIARLEAGQEVHLTTDAYPDDVFRGEISSINAKVDEDTRSVDVQATLPNKDHRLRPGMFADVEVLAGKAREIVTVPRTAITYSLYGDTVYVVQSKTEGEENVLTVDRRNVRTGETIEDRVEIAEGIQPGEQVVTVGQLKLRPGAAIALTDNGKLETAARRPME